MMTDKHDFKATLEYMQSNHYQPQDMMDAFYEEIQTALHFADRLQSGEVGFEESCIWREWINLGCDCDSCVRSAHKAMAAQMIKEIEDDR